MPEQNDLVRADIVAVDELPVYLANLHGREKHIYLPYKWQQEGGHGADGGIYQMTHYLVISWKCRG